MHPVTQTVHSAGISRELDLPFDHAVRRAEEELAKEGFGVLTRIDVAATFRAKLGVDYPPCVILGACHPQLAHSAMSLVPEIALVMPCNVVIRAGDEEGTVRVEAVNVSSMARLLENTALSDIAEEVTAKLYRVVHAI
jgi:uncharacterized protein (DUF302 family)